MNYYKISLRAGPQKFQTFLGSRLFSISILYRAAEIGGAWYMDLSTADGADSLNGIPMVLGVDLLAQYQYKEWGHLWVRVDAGDADLTEYSGLTDNVSLIWGG